MAEGRGRAEWGRTASMMALVANVNRDPRKRRKPFQPDDFIPPAYKARREKPAVIKAGFGVLKMIFCRSTGDKNRKAR